MAKSLRSKSKQRNKVVKRQTVFGEAAQARENRIAERLHNAAIEDIMAKQQLPGVDALMDVDQTEKPRPKAAATAAAAAVSKDSKEKKRAYKKESKKNKKSKTARKFFAYR